MMQRNNNSENQEKTGESILAGTAESIGME